MVHPDTPLSGLQLILFKTDEAKASNEGNLPNNKILDSKYISVSRAERIACSLYIEWSPPITNLVQWNEWE